MEEKGETRSDRDLASPVLMTQQPLPAHFDQMRKEPPLLSPRGHNLGQGAWLSKLNLQEDVRPHGPSV
jgi:hypothetical protein